MIKRQTHFIRTLFFGFALSFSLSCSACSGQAAKTNAQPQGSPTVAGSGQASINQNIPEKIDARARYLFYLHGRIVEDRGIRAVHERHGVYEFEKILEAFKAANFVVISEGRAKDTDVKGYAAKVVAQINGLLKTGVPPRHITVVGASKGASIVMHTSSLLKHREINFVLMAGCGEQTLKNSELNLYGNVLSIYDASDEGVGTCKTLFTRAGGLNRHKEVKINLGLGHGFLYRPHKEWIEPVVEWAKQF